MSMQSQSLLGQSNPEETDHQLSAVQQLLHRVGGEGRFQICTFAVFVLLWFLTSWLLLGMSFFFDDDYTCVDPAYDTQKKCQDFICSLQPQQRKAAIATHSNSITFEFENYMICDEYDYQVPLLQSMLFFGALVGFFVIPNIADNSGRKPALRMAWVIGIVSVAMLFLADSPAIVAFALFFIGFGTNPAITLAFSFINQQCLGKSRQRFGVGVQLGLATGQSTIALIFLSDLTWRGILMWMLILFVLAYIPLELLLKETPMYLIEKSPQMALKLLNEIAKINKNQIISQEEFQRLSPKDVQQQQGSSVGIMDLFRYKSLRWISISTGFIFLGIQTIYYSTTLNLGDLGFNKTVNQVIFGVSEFFGYIGAEFVVHKLKRKTASYYGLGIASAMCFVLGILLIFQDNDNKATLAWFEAVGLVINRFVLCGFWSIFYVFVAELFPTQVRSLGYGFTSVTGMIGSSLSPYITTISSSIHVNNWFPPAILGFVSCAFIFKLPETFGKPLKDMIEQQQHHKESGENGSSLATDG